MADVRPDFEKARDTGWSRYCRHPRVGVGGYGARTYTMSNVGRARAETALALESMATFRRTLALMHRGDWHRAIAKAWFVAYRDAAGWRCRAEDSVRRGAPTDMGAVCGLRMKTVGHAHQFQTMGWWLLTAAGPVWFEDRDMLGYDRLTRRTP